MYIESTRNTIYSFPIEMFMSYQITYQMLIELKL